MHTQRKIIHIDADSFYASVETRENPSLKGKPIAVGGLPNTRGVIATCNYIARQFGIHSAMPSSQAAKMCPELIFIQPNFPLYKEASRQIQNIMARYTEIIEPLSLDEAYLDVSASPHFQGSATHIARAIKDSVQNELDLIVSAGVAPNKFLAKVASDWKKPDGLFVIRPNDIEEFIQTLPVKRINGVGKVTAQKLEKMHIRTCGDLQNHSLESLTQHFGKYGYRLYEYARGIDTRPVQTNRLRKSLSVEHTYIQDIRHQQTLTEKAGELFAELVRRSEKLDNNTSIKARFVKIKFSDFSQTTLEESLNPHDKQWQSEAVYLRLIQEASQRQKKPIRLMGMGIRLNRIKSASQREQLDLFENQQLAEP